MPIIQAKPAVEPQLGKVSLKGKKHETRRGVSEEMEMIHRILKIRSLDFKYLQQQHQYDGNKMLCTVLETLSFLQASLAPYHV